MLARPWPALMSQKRYTKKWIIRETGDPVAYAAAAEIAAALGVLFPTARLLVNRGYRTCEAARRFVRMETEYLHNPFLMADMDKGVTRILEAVERGEKITVYGDYDVDGVTAVSTLCLYLTAIGGRVDYYIPNRIGEGYGVSEGALERIAQSGTRLLVTVDTGITANAEVAYAKTLGLEVIVTDHHECRGELPEACAVINPCRPDCPYPFKELAGVGVVFKLVCALEETRQGGKKSRLDCVRDICYRYADLVALGTIADVMPVRDENRLIISLGLKMMENTKRCGLAALFAAATRTSEAKQVSGRRAERRPKITSVFIGYTIAPRINAAGRISSAELAVELFLTESADRAEEIARKLCEINRERQTEENRIAEQVYERIEKEYDLENAGVIVLDADDWHHGIIGIVASRVTEKFGLPSILISFEGSVGEAPSGEDIGKGSGRSVKGINLVDALVYCGDLLIRYGGHELAAGLSLERKMVPRFREKINEYVLKNYTKDLLTPAIEADFELRMEEISLQLAEEIRLLEPYGVSNPAPVFVLREAKITDIQPVCAGKHTKLVLAQDGCAMVAMCFSFSQEEMDLYPGDFVDLLFNLDINEYNSQKHVQLIARDIRLSERARAELAGMRARVREILAGAPILSGEAVVPEREDFVAVYTLLRRELRMGRRQMTHRSLLAKLLAAHGPADMNYIRLKFVLLILEEMNLLGITETAEDSYQFSLPDAGTKIDLDRSLILQRLRAMCPKK